MNKKHSAYCPGAYGIPNARSCVCDGTSVPALKEEILKSIMGESQFDNVLLKEMMEENKRAQVEAEREIDESKSEAADEQTRVKHLEEQYKKHPRSGSRIRHIPEGTCKMRLAHESGCAVCGAKS